MWDFGPRAARSRTQATDATLGHAQATSADPAQMTAIAAFESALYTAQAVDTVAGALDAGGATGGPSALASQAFHVGINDPFGRDPQHGGFSRNVFTLYAAWATLTGSDAQTQQRLLDRARRGRSSTRAGRYAISGAVARHRRPGRRDVLDLPRHAGHRRPLGRRDDEPRARQQQPPHGRPVALHADPHAERRHDAAGRRDPGRAMVSGKWADVGLFKIPGLRGLAMRAPYFHNGFSPTLTDLVSFYNDKFTIGLSTQDMADMVAFLERAVEPAALLRARLSREEHPEPAAADTIAGAQAGAERRVLVVQAHTAIATSSGGAAAGLASGARDSAGSACALLVARVAIAAAQPCGCARTRRAARTDPPTR